MPRPKGCKGPPKGKKPFKKRQTKLTRLTDAAGVAASGASSGPGVEVLRRQLAKFPKSPALRDRVELLTALTMGETVSAEELDKLSNEAEAPCFKRCMVEAGSVRALVALLGGDGRLPEAASRLLWSIALDSSSADKLAIVGGGALPKLMAMVASDEESTAGSAAGALACLVDSDMPIKLQFMGLGGVSAMFGVMGSGTSKVSGMVARVIASLVCGSDACRQRVFDEGGLAVLEDKWASADISEADVFGWAVRCLCSDTEDFRSILCSGRIVTICLDKIRSIASGPAALQDQTLDISRGVLITVFNVLGYVLSGPRGMRETIIETGLPGMLIDYLAAGNLPQKILMEMDRFLRSFTNRELITTASYSSLTTLYLRYLCSDDLTKAASAAESLVAMASLSRESGMKLLDAGVLEIFLYHLDPADGVRAMWAGVFCSKLIETVGKRIREAIVDAGALPKLARLLEYGTANQAGVAVDVLATVGAGDSSQKAAVRAAIGDASHCSALVSRKGEPSFARLFELCTGEAGGSVTTDTVSDAASSGSDSDGSEWLGVNPAVLTGARADAVILGAKFSDPTGLGYELVIEC